MPDQSKHQHKVRLEYLAFALMSCTLNAAVVELLPGQIQPSLTPYSAITLGANQSRYLGSYISGNRETHTDYQEQEASIGFSHNNQFNQVPYILAASLGYQGLLFEQPSASYRERNEGVYDLRLAAGFWPWVDVANKHHLAFAVVTTLPTGSYDRDRSLNIGENRYRLTGIMSVKYQLSSRFYSESFFLYNWISDNQHYRTSATEVGTLSQAPSYSWTSYLVYQHSQPWQYYVGLEQTIGTEQQLNHQLYANAQKDFRGYIGSSLAIDASNIVQLRYGQTLSIETGYKQEHQIILKLSNLF